jgi:hypothetical protein
MTVTLLLLTVSRKKKGSLITGADCLPAQAQAERPAHAVRIAVGEFAAQCGIKL